MGDGPDGVGRAFASCNDFWRDLIPTFPHHGVPHQSRYHYYYLSSPDRRVIFGWVFKHGGI